MIPMPKYSILYARVGTELALKRSTLEPIGATDFGTPDCTDQDCDRKPNLVPNVFSNTCPGYDQVTTEPDRDGRVENPCLPGTRGHGRGILVHYLSERKSPTYLGHIVDKQGIRPNPKKVEAVQTWPVPKNVHDVRSFLGLVNYFRKFIDHYSEIAVPLTNLTRKASAWNWTGRCQDAFELLKEKLVEAPLLRTSNERLPYEVVTDASDLGLGAMLLQEGHPVACESTKLNSAELNYNVTEKEMLAVVHALHVWRCYLEGADFTVYTGHVSNTFFQTQPNLSRRQARWSEFLQRFGNFVWKYRKGASNVADALSQKNVARSVWRYCRAARSIVVGTGEAVAARDRKTYQCISIPCQGESVSSNRSCAEMLTFDLSIFPCSNA
jgi:hypothetical protein